MSAVVPRADSSVPGAGGKPSRLADVARQAGVSIGVAGNILNAGKGNSRASAATIARVRKVAAALRYTPHMAARQLRGKRTYMYGILVASAGDPLRSFLVQDLDIESIKLGCRTVICNTVGNPQAGPDRFDAEVEALSHRGVDGVFCAIHRWWPGDRAALLRTHPNTVFYEDPGIPGAAFVTADRAAAVRMAVGHLVSRGRRRIGLAVENMRAFGGPARLAGYREAIESLRIPFDPHLTFDGQQPDWVCGSYDNASGTWYFPTEVAERALDHLVVRERADAIVAHNDYWASVFIRLLRARGLRVPQDVAVVGYLNHYLADWTDPPLTSISLRYDVAAHAMVTMLEQMITEGGLPEQERRVLVAPRLIQRGSS